ncbi:hypothetical protein [uncultured Kordia sp.]|uniref:hypothetical protein n=1 Tax=uncultured Kordia sp. TaxID=507699 RepID=UPI002636E77B|nr:hypothetical protein [uncultured Kordia sp.]
MTFQKSPFPYVFLFIVMMSITIYFNFSVDASIEQPIVHTIEKQETSSYQIATEEATTDSPTVVSNY